MKEYHNNQNMTNKLPLATPSIALVEKNATFFVSNRFSLVHSVERNSASDSPVIHELST